jgi:ubiquinone/menaquinone biosynthesis C-methylase UbiE
MFPLLDKISTESSNYVINDLGRVKEVYPNLEVFELNYNWSPDIEDSITPVIKFEWEVLNKRLGQLHVSGAERILSIGGGGNSPTLDYISNFLEYLCVLNPSERDLETYSKRTRLDNRILLVRGVGEMIPFRDESFDLVEITSALDHCHDHRKVLEESYRVLEENGKVAITGGNNQSWYRNLVAYLKIPFRDVHDHHHTIHLEPIMLHDLLTSVGFCDIQITTNYFLKLPKSIEKLFGSRIALKVYGLISNNVLPKIFGSHKGGMLLISATKKKP